MVADLPWDENERELNALCEIIGRLVVEYARAEAYVHLLAGRVLGNDTVGSVVFDGMRLVDLTKRIRGMLRANDAADHDYADIDACLVQLAEIGKIRQKLAHRFVELGSDLIRTHNLYTAKTVEGQEIDEIDPLHVKAMISDCQRIRRRILRHTDGEVRRRENPRHDAYDPSWLAALFEPWRYLPPLSPPQKEARKGGDRSPKRNRRGG